MLCVVIDKVERPGLIGVIGHMHNAAHHVRVDTIAVHVQPGATA